MTSEYCSIDAAIQEDLAVSAPASSFDTERVLLLLVQREGGNDLGNRCRRTRAREKNHIVIGASFALLQKFQTAGTRTIDGKVQRG